ncbi:hypothetical protein ACTWQL_23390 [Pseudalkalibacillus sp. R45]|uniref:hypothetical protein n=1 Tax=Pseudalkalibacillus sp. R45 TaxID=3457433 RepID=UPI003FCE2ACE
MRDSSGISGTGEIIQCRKATNGLTARPAESEHPGAEINDFQEQQHLRKNKKDLPYDKGDPFAQEEALAR